MYTGETRSHLVNESLLAAYVMDVEDRDTKPWLSRYNIDDNKVLSFCFVLLCFSQWKSIVIKLKNNAQTHNVTLTLMNLFGGNLFRTYQYYIFCR